MPDSLTAGWSHLTGAILQLQNSIRAYRESQASTAPKKAYDLDVQQGILDDYEQKLRRRGQWRTQDAIQPLPTMAINITQLDNAIANLGRGVDGFWFPQVATTPQIEFSTQKWRWDDDWCEWYYEYAGPEDCVYLDLWELDGALDEWIRVQQSQVSAEESLAFLGCWEDWRWDERWGEWYLPLVGEVAGPEGANRSFFATRWRVQGENWVYVSRRNAEVEELEDEDGSTSGDEDESTSGDEDESTSGDEDESTSGDEDESTSEGDESGSGYEDGSTSEDEDDSTGLILFVMQNAHSLPSLQTQSTAGN